MMEKTFRNREVEAEFNISKGVPRSHGKDGSFLMFIWNDSTRPVCFSVDDRSVELNSGQITCTTYLQKVNFGNSKDLDDLKFLRFNREFYCVHTNDSEVSCNGLLFFGSNFNPILNLNDEESHRLRTLFHVLAEEFDMKESSQEEMLRILLKRFIIRCTRLANKQLLKDGDNQTEIDLIRQYNVLVEEHFKSKKSVSEYADLLYKSTKTIANVFSKNSDMTPLEVIHKRVIMEAKRMLLYTDKTAKEIGYELGYNDPAQFSKLFKKQTGMTTTQFLKKNQS
ncbi:helix-turn-helix domain-containing protein [Rhodohalobacter barkolensis]|uniref:AraC family transcriptional regulator n=1 Tax=Rhodohalobacter barkolensis TaxID=2053187 RepID=A0A2N0VJD7_9BACT|nr:AraC family transcriptional regulator [Rhodohalobacter barkolensis]PKD44307.1 AraC family transcriptional regulator [Rhodohalobacter barkolensis]